MFYPIRIVFAFHKSKPSISFLIIRLPPANLWVLHISRFLSKQSNIPIRLCSLASCYISLTRSRCRISDNSLHMMYILCLSVLSQLLFRLVLAGTSDAFLTQNPRLTAESRPPLLNLRQSCIFIWCILRYLRVYDMFTVIK